MSTEAVEQAAILLEHEANGTGLFVDQFTELSDAVDLVESFGKPSRSLYSADLGDSDRGLGKGTLCFASNPGMGAFRRRLADFGGKQLGMLLARTLLIEQRAQWRNEIAEITEDLADPSPAERRRPPPPNAGSPNNARRPGSKKLCCGLRYRVLSSNGLARTKNRMKLLIIPVLALAADPNYLRHVEQYRAQREASLKQDDGWLTVVGLFRLKEGENRIGSADEIALPFPAPAHAGKITFSRGQATYFAEGKPGVALNDAITIGNIKFFVIKRGDEYFIRVKDNDSKLRRDFTGLKWFPVDPSWKITAKFTPYAAPKTILFDSQNGVKQPMESPGYVTFTRDGKAYRLDPVLEGAELFFIFRDSTSNKTTYGAARFLYAAPAKSGVVILDFNQAINPPCAFTPFATCPLPPPQNRLALAVTAGEKKYSETEP